MSILVLVCLLVNSNLPYLYSRSMSIDFQVGAPKNWFEKGRISSPTLPALNIHVKMAAPYCLVCIGIHIYWESQFLTCLVKVI